MLSGSDDDAVQGRFYAEFWRAPAAIAAIGFDGVVLACNAAYGEILGAEPRDLVGTDSGDVVCPAEVAQVVGESVVRIETGRTTATAPSRFNYATGTEPPFGCSSTPRSSTMAATTRTCSPR